jgi:hypothetical protein
MSSTLLRLGLWILVIILALYVVHESFEDSPVAELVPLEMLQKALAVGGLLIVAGVVVRLLEKGSRKVVRNHCAVCRTVIPPGALYCREHLRRILHDEDERTHVTRIRGDATVNRRPAPPAARPATMAGLRHAPLIPPEPGTRMRGEGGGGQAPDDGSKSGSR